MKIKIFQTDAFTEEVFRGNPAAVCPLDEWLADDMMQNIASENFLPETAFFIPSKDGSGYHLRWFTPEMEMDLCGHATLATAHVIFNHLGYTKEKILFQSRSGELQVTKNGQLLILDFPSRPPVHTSLPEVISEAIGFRPLHTLKARDYVLVFDSENVIRKINPDKNLLDKIDLGHGGIIVTAKGNKVDFVSRFFSPGSSIMEDPVTGSAHCSLVPYWSEVLNKTELIALQLSHRGGKLHCTDKGDRVLIGGYAKTYLEGFIYV